MATSSRRCPYRNTMARERECGSPIIVAVTRAALLPKEEEDGSPHDRWMHGTRAATMSSSCVAGASVGRGRLISSAAWGGSAAISGDASPSFSSVRDPTGRPDARVPACAGPPRLRLGARGRPGLAPAKRRADSSGGASSGVSTNWSSATDVRSLHPWATTRPRAPLSSPTTALPNRVAGARSKRARLMMPDEVDDPVWGDATAGPNLLGACSIEMRPTCEQKDIKELNTMRSGPRASIARHTQQSQHTEKDDKHMKAG